MPRKKKESPADYVEPININGLNGRMLHIPGPKPDSREVLFIYGHHSSLERWWGVVRFISRYASVTMPDLPGFGGMDSFYKIGKPASLDNLADYMAAFMKMRYGKRKKVTVVGLSLGFVVATRMLQRWPRLTKNIEMLVSFVGFAHHQDFTFTNRRKFFYRWGARLFSLRLPAAFFRYVCLHPYLIRKIYTRTMSAKEKFDGVVGDELEEIINFEINLWHDNDVRTYMRTTSEFIALDNCTKQVDLPVYHVAVEGDRYFDNTIVEQHLRVIFSDYVLLETLSDVQHSPSVIADELAAKAFIPPKFRRLLLRR
jgi:pimeloyl-ACP methyl ester carboxylesterase